MMTATTVARRAGRASLLAVAMATIALGCSSDGSSPLTTAELPAAPAETSPPEEAPPAETAPPEEAPPAETAPPEEAAPEEQAPPATTPSDTDSDSSDTWLIVFLVIAVIAVIALIGALMSRRKGGPTTASPEQARLDAALRNGRILHDSTSLSLLQPSEAPTLQSTWNVAQRQFIELESQVGALTSVVSDAAALQVLQALASSSAALRGALESNVNLRLSGEGAGQAGVVDASNQTVLARRAEFDGALQQAGYLRL